MGASCSSLPHDLLHRLGLRATSEDELDLQLSLSLRVGVEYLAGIVAEINSTVRVEPYRVVRNNLLNVVEKVEELHAEL